MEKAKSKCETNIANAKASRQKLHRNYCFLVSGDKHNRNWVCKWHDNAYGINGGGNGEDRLTADKAMFAHMKENKDPLCYVAYIAVRLFGWAFFNYKEGLWRGQLTKKFSKKK